MTAGVVETEGRVDRAQVQPYLEMVCETEMFLRGLPKDQELLVNLRGADEVGVLEEIMCWLLGSNILDVDDLRAHLDDYEITLENALVSGVAGVEVFRNGTLLHRHRRETMFSAEYVCTCAAEVALERKVAACESLEDLRRLGFDTISDEGPISGPFRMTSLALAQDGAVEEPSRERIGYVAETDDSFDVRTAQVDGEDGFVIGEDVYLPDKPAGYWDENPDEQSVWRLTITACVAFTQARAFGSLSYTEMMGMRPQELRDVFLSKVLAEAIRAGMVPEDYIDALATEDCIDWSRFLEHYDFFLRRTAEAALRCDESAVSAGVL